METKKNPSKDLERLSPAFLKFGLVVALGLVLLAFNVKTTDRGGIKLNGVVLVIPPEDLPPITRPPEEKPKPIPTQKISIVDDVIDVEDDLLIIADAGMLDYVPDARSEIVLADEPEVDENVPFIHVDEYPSFVGGEEARQAFLRENARYPNLAKEMRIQGTVFVSFIVERDGSITNVEVLRGIGGGCDEETERVARLMPRWNPGKQRNRPVRTHFRMPVRFVLQ